MIIVCYILRDMYVMCVMCYVCYMLCVLYVILLFVVRLQLA